MKEKVDEEIEMTFDLLEFHAFEEVGQGSGRVGSDSWDWIVLKEIDQFRENGVPVFLLESRLHIIRNLTDCVTCGVSHHGILVSQETHNHLQN